MADALTSQCDNAREHAGIGVHGTSPGIDQNVMNVQVVNCCLCHSGSK